MILAGDVGGTKTNLACYQFAKGALIECASASYRSRSFPDLESVAKKFIEEKAMAPTIACFGVAGPVKKNRSALPNLQWGLDGRSIAGALGVESVWLLNDLEANAHGIAGLRAEDFKVLNQGEADAEGNAAIISAGTGLGEAGLYWDGQRYRPIASEGGHSDFAPRTDLDMEVFRFLRAQFGHVSWERVLSGPGLFNIYRFLRTATPDRENESVRLQIEQGDPAAAIAKAAEDGTCSLCAHAMELFVKYYAAEASNLALKVMSSGGLYIGGGIAPKIIHRLERPEFLKEFCEAGRMSGLLEAMPVKVIMNDKTALLGAALYALERVRSA